MSKGKYKRKRERAKKRVEEKVAQIQVARSAGIDTDIQPEHAKLSKSEAEEKSKTPMSTPKIKELTPKSDLWIRYFTGVLTVVAIFQMVITKNQLGVMRNDGWCLKSALVAIAPA